MRDIVVAAQDDPRIGLPQFLQVGIELLQPMIFELLPLFTTRSGWEIRIDQPKIADVQLDHAAFIVTYLMACTVLDPVRLYLRKNSYPAISFFLRGEPIVVVSQ